MYCHGLQCSSLLTKIFQIKKDSEATVSAIPLKDVSTTTTSPSSTEVEKASSPMTTEQPTSKYYASTKMVEDSDASTFLPVVTYRSASKDNHRYNYYCDSIFDG